MAQKVDIQVNLTIISGKNLPKTDRFSAIDAYMVVNVPNYSQVKTKVVDDNANPVWDSTHNVMLSYDFQSPTPLPKISFELWDKNTLKDEKVSTAEFQVMPVHLQNPGAIEVPLHHLNSKHTKDSSILIRFGEYAYSAESLYRLISPSLPGVQFSREGLGRIYIPLSFPNTILALEYEKTCVDLKLYVTNSSTVETSFLDMVRVNHACSEVRRRNVSSPFHINGFPVFEEIKMNDVPFSVLSQPGRVMFFVFQKQLLSRESLDKVVTHHGWSGAMSWATASAKLNNVELDKKEEEIFMKRDDSFIVVDFDKDNVDMKCMVLDVPQNADIAYDFRYSGDDVKKTSQIYSPPKPVLGGKYTVQRKLELDDVPFGTPFAKMEWFKYRVTAPVKVDIFDVIKFHPF